VKKVVKNKSRKNGKIKEKVIDTILVILSDLLKSQKGKCVHLTYSKITKYLWSKKDDVSIYIRTPLGRVMVKEILSKLANSVEEQSNYCVYTICRDNMFWELIEKGDFEKVKKYLR